MCWSMPLFKSTQEFSDLIHRKGLFDIEEEIYGHFLSPHIYDHLFEGSQVSNDLRVPSQMKVQSFCLATVSNFLCDQAMETRMRRELEPDLKHVTCPSFLICLKFTNQHVSLLHISSQRPAVWPCYSTSRYFRAPSHPKLCFFTTLRLMHIHGVHSATCNQKNRVQKAMHIRRLSWANLDI